MEENTINEENVQTNEQPEVPLYKRIMVFMIAIMVTIIVVLLLKDGVLEKGDHRPSGILEPDKQTVQTYSFSEFFGENEIK